MALESLARHWQRVTPITWLLLPLSFLFAAISRVRRALYRARVLPVTRVPVPVIVVGNLVAGGSGKTPLVLWIARYLHGKGWRPGIVSRGHGGSLAASGGPPSGVNAASDPAVVGDEPLLLARRANCPVWIGVDRAAACKSLLVQHPEVDVLVLDDGLQHYALARDIEIAVVDGRGFGNGHRIPAGPLREPVSRLAGVDAVVRNGTAAVEGFDLRLIGTDFVNLANRSLRVESDRLGAKRVHGVAGIGDPSRFFRSLGALGLEVIEHAFPDHHPYAVRDLEFGDALPVVMTEKDAVKCESFAAAHFWMVPVDAELDDAFGAMLESKLREAKLRETSQGKRRGP